MSSKTAVFEGGTASDGEDQAGLNNQLPDNCVEYLLFVLDSQLEARRQLSQIEAVRKSAIDLATSLTGDYIWQKDEFNLTLKNEQGLVYLHGITDYGDAVEDEWLIVYILRELTKSHTKLWIRVFDTDGEFLLVEAANVLPRWLNPEIDNNRTWIHNGKLLIIPVKDEKNLKPRNLTLSDAVEALKTKPDALVHSAFVEAEAFYRLEKYPAQITESIHHSLVTIPRKLAYVLHSLPKSVAPAVEAFYLRDPIALKRVISPTEPPVFPPQDLVTVSVRFSKVLFAQLPRLDIGMKLTCGFEMLAAKAEKSKSRVVREMAIVLEDLEEDGDDVLPTDQDIKSWGDATRDDSEAWMDINYEDFEKELDGKRGAAKEGETSGFGDANTQSDLRKIVSRFEAFLNDDSAGVEGAELDEMDFDDDEDDEFSDEDSDAEDKEVSFDEEEFARMMREMMGLPSSTPTPGKKESPKKESPTPAPKSSGEDETEDEEIRKLTTEFEAELNHHGALKLDPAKEKRPRLKDKSPKAGESSQSTPLPDVAEEDEDSEEDVDIDYNLAKNLLESFKSQAGMAGPTGNLLGLMGIQLPRDEDDENGQDAEKDAGNRTIKGKGKA
ncbi:hypothetical protein CEP52_002267 [Fusarium oligoseptatum]|uniref:Uncharacterized protein n=1 Tax=Fusarium oligoseptatum TaxID=2604345 RepID=A0A428UF34_9HYPO|nr:hypothetical protein CEP52_002267 [Fusarium oligoseptatum]